MLARQFADEMNKHLGQGEKMSVARTQAMITVLENNRPLAEKVLGHLDEIHGWSAQAEPRPETPETEAAS